MLKELKNKIVKNNLRWKMVEKQVALKMDEIIMPIKKRYRRLLISLILSSLSQIFIISPEELSEIAYAACLKTPDPINNHTSLK